MDNAEVLGLFKRRFRGHDKYHGQCPCSGETAADGQLLRPWTEKVRPLIDKKWMAHLMGGQGNMGLGVVPVTEDGQCYFGAIDYDTKPGEADLRDICDRVKMQGLPLIVCRSRSGGAHLYLFLREPTKASEVSRKLWAWSRVLGLDKCPVPDKFGKHRSSEIFPKQASVGDNYGSWINLPYYSAKETVRYAYDGKRLSITDFLKKSDQVALTSTQLASYEADIASTLNAEAPPCLQALDAAGYQDGMRGNGLFNLGLYFEKVDADHWRERLREYNAVRMDPPVEESSVTGTIRSLERDFVKQTRVYAYNCNDQPINSFCDKITCKKRKFGIQSFSSVSKVDIDRLVKIDVDPPKYLVFMAGKEMELTTGELLDPRAFKKKAFEVLDVMIPVTKLAAWDQMIKDLLIGMEVIDAPEDAGTFGQFKAFFRMFMERRQSCDGEEGWQELLRGSPLEREDESGLRVVYFLSRHLLKELEEKRRFREYKGNELYAAIRRMGGWHQRQGRRICGQSEHLWVIPASKIEPAQTEPFTQPTPDPKEDF